MAKIVTETGLRYNCIVRDLSVGGAMLRVPSNADITGRISISSEAVGTARAADVIWADETSIGISFVEPKL